MDEPIILIKDLTFTYSGLNKTSIKNVNFNASQGEFIVLTGPSGCGKTTLCRCLNGLIPNFYPGEMRGEVYVCGLNTQEHSTSELAKHVGFVFQNPENQLFSLTIERDVAFGLENLGIPKKEIKERVDWALNVIGINDLKDKAPYELSGGQQQKAAIATVLAMKPEIIVLDEPTSFLDPKSALEILKVIRNLNKQFKITIVLVEHRLDFVSQFADRIVIMNEGEIVLDGRPSKVLSEEAYLLGVGLPKIAFLFHQLKQEGFNFTLTPVTIEEAVKELRRFIK
ncbi:ATP-binding cassette domain-containing protein [Candidatus Bathyarchaeota archaeon]|nr:ATP-binding cassette domain-containing protein [Candidatus Bathyarchaeota archaeon]